MSLKINKKEFKIIGLVSSVLAILIPIVFYQKSISTAPADFLKSFFTTCIYTFTLWLVNASIAKYAWKIFPYPKYAQKNVLTQVLLIPTVTFLVVIPLVYLDSLVHNATFRELFVLNLLISLGITVFITSIYNSYFLFRSLKSSIAEKERLEKANVQSQLEILKNQIKPHFLFNSLNTLASLIPEDPTQSVQYVESLAKVYRYILEIKDKKLIPIKDELECIADYLFMLQIRFGENLKVRIDEKGLDHSHHIVPLSLQLLIENAMKHNIVSNKKRLFIDVYMGEAGRLHVSNNLQKKDLAEPSTGIGLKNINERYEIIGDKSIDIIVTEKKFTVSIPLIKVA